MKQTSHEERLYLHKRCSRVGESSRRPHCVSFNVRTKTSSWIIILILHLREIHKVGIIMITLGEDVLSSGLKRLKVQKGRATLALFQSKHSFILAFEFEAPLELSIINHNQLKVRKFNGITYANGALLSAWNQTPNIVTVSQAWGCQTARQRCKR